MMRTIVPTEYRYSGVGIVHVLALRDREEPPVAVQRLLDGLHRPRTAGRDRHGDSGIHDGVAEW